jgi:Zn finger protein HypA/HybF involved in hydrogenase expression
MDKYGVETPLPAEKVAEEKEKEPVARCHRCGAVVRNEGNTLFCPNCGTEPFEAP